MKVIKGKNNFAKVYTDEVEQTALDQIELLCDQPWTKGLQIRIMSDVHAGAGCTIGTTMEVKDYVVPNLVGVDIGCGMEVAKLAPQDIDLVKLDRFIRKKVPSGFAKRSVPHNLYAPLAKQEVNNLFAKDIISNAGGMEAILVSVGTLGGGNHFIEMNKNENGELYIVIHSGSRNFGLQIANYYQKIADERQPFADKGLAFLTGNTTKDYLHDMMIAQKFATLNRHAMMYDILQYLDVEPVETFTTIHNYIDPETHILRKGAVSAKDGEKFIVPINMRDGSLICVGKGNKDWNYSAPHGAGRLMSRMQAKKNLSVDEFKKQMDGIYTTSANVSTLDESPMAYKGMGNIVNNIEPTADIIENIKPIYNFKAAERGR